MLGLPNAQRSMKRFVNDVIVECTLILFALSFAASGDIHLIGINARSRIVRRNSQEQFLVVLPPSPPLEMHLQQRKH